MEDFCKNFCFVPEMLRIGLTTGRSGKFQSLQQNLIKSAIAVISLHPLPPQNEYSPNSLDLYHKHVFWMHSEAVCARCRYV